MPPASFERCRGTEKLFNLASNYHQRFAIQRRFSQSRKRSFVGAQRNLNVGQLSGEASEPWNDRFVSESWLSRCRLTWWPHHESGCWLRKQGNSCSSPTGYVDCLCRCGNRPCGDDQSRRFARLCICGMVQEQPAGSERKAGGNQPIDFVCEFAD